MVKTVTIFVMYCERFFSEFIFLFLKQYEYALTTNVKLWYREGSSGIQLISIATFNLTLFI